MCSAVRRRMLVKGLISSVPAVGGAVAAGAGAGAGGDAVGTAGATGATAVAGAAATPDAGAPPARRLSMKLSTSDLVTRPPRPVPTTSAGAMALSSSRRRTTGDKIRSPHFPGPSPATGDEGGAAATGAAGG